MTEEESRSWIRSVGENIAAISAEIHGSDRFPAFYNAHGPSLNGFPGIWMLCAWAGLAYQNVENRINTDAIDNYEWIDNIIHYAQKILDVSESDDPADYNHNDLMSMTWLEALAETSIKEWAEATNGTNGTAIHIDRAKPVAPMARPTHRFPSVTTRRRLIDLPKPVQGTPQT